MKHYVNLFKTIFTIPKISFVFPITKCSFINVYKSGFSKTRKSNFPKKKLPKYAFCSILLFCGNFFFYKMILFYIYILYYMAIS